MQAIKSLGDLNAFRVVVKHPGHADQSVHGRRFGLGATRMFGGQYARRMTSEGAWHFPGIGSVYPDIDEGYGKVSGWRAFHSGRGLGSPGYSKREQAMRSLLSFNRKGKWNRPRYKVKRTLIS